jgi:uncharacterized protein (DUF362 family)
MKRSGCNRGWSRRQVLAAVAGVTAIPRPARAAPVSPVAVARCQTYGKGLLPVMERMFDQLGGLGKLVSGKTVAVKINMTGGATTRLRHMPAETTYWTHPDITGTLTYLLSRAGARRIRILESFSAGTFPLEEQMIVAGWEPNDLLNAAKNVELENTGFLGYGKQYHRMNVEGGGYIYPGFDLNHSYEECDVFVSVAKLKEHFTAGVTLAMKNLFGIAPVTIYGSGAGVDEPSLAPAGGRAMFHTGYRQPSKSAPGELNPGQSEEGGYRVPRIVTDLVGARPIHLSLIDGIETMNGAEGPWIENRGRASIEHLKPGVLIAGLNPVCTDAVSTAVMGFDPMAERGTAPFETCDSTMQLGEAKGIGSRDLARIEVIGAPIKDVRFPFRRS